MENWHSSHPLVRSGIVMSLVALVISLVGISSNYWLTYKSIHLGLYTFCKYSLCFSFNNLNGDMGWYRGVQFCVSVGFICTIAAVIMGIVFLVKTALINNKVYKISLVVISAIGGTLLLIGVIIAGIKGTRSHFYIAWSLVLAGLGAIIETIASSLIEVGFRKMNISS